jgi:hypothetical protein
VLISCFEVTNLETAGWSQFQRVKASSLVSAKEIAASAIQRGRRKKTLRL